MMHQKKIAKLKHKVFYKDRPRINNNLIDSGNRNHKHSIPEIITKLSDKTYNHHSRFGGGSKKTLALHHNLAYVSYSIPLLSTLALLVVGLVATNPFGTLSAVDKASAVGNVIDVDYQRVMRSTATLTITPATNGGHGATNGVATEIIPGSVGYRAHDVSASVSDSTSYMLNLSYTENDKSLHLADGNMYLDPVPYDGVEGSENMAEDNWGFAWGDKDSVDANMTYYQVPQYNQAGSGIKNGILELDVTGADRSATIDKKLVFAANFSPNTISGHYVASILLSLSATPNDISRLSELTRLQDITPQICRNSAVGETTITPLVDSLDGKNKEYSAIRAGDGNCWFRENLALDLNGITLTPADSNVTEKWESDTGASATWGNVGNAAKFFDGAGGTGYTTVSEYGYYYSFGAATAGTSKDFTSSSSQQTTQDICPKGWRLPTKDDYVALIGTAKPYNGAWNATSKAFVMDSTTIGNLSFPAAGRVYNSALANAGSEGYYCSSTTNSSSNAYVFNFTSGTTAPQSGNYRYGGYSVRCMAKRLGDA